MKRSIYAKTSKPHLNAQKDQLSAVTFSRPKLEQILQEGCFGSSDRLFSLDDWGRALALLLLV
jgi:hypothetical protein